MFPTRYGTISSCFRTLGNYVGEIYWGYVPTLFDRWSGGPVALRIRRLAAAADDDDDVDCCRSAR